MSITLTPEQETRLKRSAARLGKPIEQVIEEMIATLPDDTAKEKTWGAEVWDALEAEGFTGLWQDRQKSSEELSRQFREKAQRRSVAE